MTTILMFVVLGLWQQLPSGPVSDVSLTLSVEDGRYVVGQPIKLVVSVRNDGPRGVWGYFGFHHGAKESELLYRRAGGLFHLFKAIPAVESRSSPDVVFPGHLVVLTPNEVKSTRIMAALDAQRQRLVLEAPGEYEFKVVCRPRMNDPNGVTLESNVVGVIVDGAPVKDRQVLREYEADKLALLVQSPLGYPMLDAGVLNRAAAFIERHRGRQLYVEEVRNALLEGLEWRVKSNRASAEERVLRERLRSEEPQD